MSTQDKLTPDSAAVQFKLATVWQAKGNVARAKAGYQEAIRLRPDYVPAHLELGQLIAQHGTLEETIAVYRRASELNPHEQCFRQKLLALCDRPVSPIDTPVISLPPAGERFAGKRHVVLYTDCSSIYGTGQWNHSLLIELADADLHVTCIQGKSVNHLIDAREQRGIRHIWLEEDDLYSRKQPARALTDDTEPRRILNSIQPDVIVFGDGAPMSNLMAKQVAQQLGIPYIVVVHCVTATWAEQYVAYLDRIREMYRHAQAVIAVSHANLDLLHDLFGLPADQGHVIFPGCSASFLGPPDREARRNLRVELGIPEDGIVVCTVASMEMRKGYHYLLKAIKVLREAEVWPLLYFVWVGTGTLEPQLRAVVEQLEAHDHIQFLGERTDVAALLDAGDIFTLTSEFEGMPLSIIEAMARGLPVIATAVSGIPEELGDTGQLLPDPTVDPGTVVSELARTIHVWSMDARVRQEKGRAGQRRAEALFTADRMVKEYRAIVHNVLECCDR